MSLELSLPIEFGSSWNHFVHDWCLDAELGYTQSDVVRALNALKQLWPDYVSNLAAETARGAGIVTAAVELGCLLADCEYASGFKSVLERVKKEERSAYSELVIVSSLSRLGYHPSFDAPIEGKNLDAKCDVDEQSVYFEVSAPHLLRRGKEAREITKKLGDDIERRVSGCRIEVELFNAPTEVELRKIVTASQDAEPGEWIVVGKMARIRKILNGQSLPPVFNGDGPQIFLAGDKTTQGASTGVIIRWEESDHRAQGSFERENHHFSGKVANVLVINVSAVTDGMFEWPVSIESLFQPDRYRKVGAVVFFDQSSVGPPEAIRRRWKVVVNPHAYVTVPKVLIKNIHSLDESHF